jgi:integrase
VLRRRRSAARELDRRGVPDPQRHLAAHTIRKTVATLITERVNAETASQQLGHSSPAITRECYISKREIAADVAHVLEELARTKGD